MLKYSFNGEKLGERGYFKYDNYNQFLFKNKERELKEFLIVVFSLIWFILAGVLATLIVNYMELSQNWIFHVSLAILIAFAPLVAIVIYKKNENKIDTKNSI